MKKLILVRHGLTRGNLERLYYGSTDLPLSGEGVRQLLSRKAAGGYPDAHGMLVVTSGMLRTEQTLEAIWGEIPHERWPDLREMDFGAFEMHGYAELKDRADYQAWLAGEMEKNKTPGGESMLDAQRRVLSGLQKMQAQERDVLAVVHGGTIVSIMQSLFPNAGKNFYEWVPQPGYGYEIDMIRREYRMIPREKV